MVHLKEPAAQDNLIKSYFGETGKAFCFEPVEMNVMNKKG